MQCGVVTILLIIYNCSDQILTTRERRQAKSREAAVKKAKANQRWKVARTAAKKHVTEISEQTSSSPASSSSAVQPSFEIEDDTAGGSNKRPKWKER